VLFSAYVSFTSLTHTHAYICVIGSNSARDQGALGGQHSPSCAETNSSSFEQGKY
jgi:hypothetical protein